MKKLFLLSIFCLAATVKGQLPGVVIYTPATGTTVASITATAVPGSTACTITGNTNLASAVIINCQMYANPTETVEDPYTIRLAPRQATVFGLRSDADSITGIARADASGYIFVEVTVNGSTAVGGAF